ncbi:lipoate--protein ligase [Spiroplasma endosymbiont of Crioceris asparagi]|uniref:lipoate--protein ligase n=1 Tax=Spiroplasma endosymbiont of Crioceris asparagi TaxID=3066286 RepID=UPI0030CDF90A
MLIFKTDTTDPRYNLAIEDFFVRSSKYQEPILFLWQNHNTIVIGRNQNVTSEVNIKLALADDVTIIRRNTGGGAVFHDLGNLNFSIIYDDKQNTGISMFQETMTPILDALKLYNLNPCFLGRNDIAINGKKISGNAMLKHQNRFLQHGTLLFNSNLELLSKYLTVDRQKIISKNIKSISSRVTNINNEAEKPIEIADFIKKLINVFSQKQNVKEITLTDEDKLEINKLFVEKYCSHDWTFNKHNDFNYKNKIYYPGKGLFEVELNIESGAIKEIKLFGDFLGFIGTNEIEQKLTNVKYDHQSILDVLKTIDIQKIFGADITNEELLNLLIM